MLCICVASSPLLLLLPDDLWVHILTFLPAGSLAVCLRVSGRVSALAECDLLWRRLVELSRAGQLPDTHPPTDAVPMGHWR